MGQYVFPALVVAGITCALVRVQLKRRRLAPVRRHVEGEPVSFRTSVGVKYRPAKAYWSLKTLPGMELIVRADSFQITSKVGAGSVLGGEWHFLGPDTTIEWSDAPARYLSTQKWIVVHGKEANEEVDLALRPPDSPRAAWDALVGVGARSLTPPPD
jgi:hypothetical protein